MTVRRRIYLAVLFGFSLAMFVLVAAWWRNGWDLRKTALVGETAAPVVGILSLIAVGAALWSVRIQHDAFDLQRKASTEQQESLNIQLHLQRQALDQQKQELLHQRDELEAELRYRRHAALREVYVPLLTAAAAYHRAVDEYFNRMLRTNGEANPRIRSEWQRPCTEAHSELKKALVPVNLVDTNEERQDHRWKLAREIRLEPWVDSAENQKAWLDVVLYRISRHTHHHVALRNHLHREFGNAVAEPSLEAREFDEKMQRDLKAKADAAEERISAQLEEQVKAEYARRDRSASGEGVEASEEGH